MENKCVRYNWDLLGIHRIFQTQRPIPMKLSECARVSFVTKGPTVAMQLANNAFSVQMFVKRRSTAKTDWPIPLKLVDQVP